MLYNKKNKTMLTWNEEWITPYESIWSILNKIMLANNISVMGICKLLVVDNLSDKNYKKEANSLLFHQFNSKKTIQFLGFDLSLYQKSLTAALLGTIDSDSVNLSSYLYKNFTYCPLCLKIGHHSILHQLSFLNFCPYHIQIPLKFEFSSLYSLENNPLAQINDKINSTQFYFNIKCKWGRANNLQIHDRTLLSLIDFNHKYKGEKKKIFIEKKYSNKSTFNLTFLFPIINNSFKGKQNEFQTFTSPAYARSHKKFNPREAKRNIELFISTQQTYRSLARHIRTKVVNPHHRCIKKYVRLHPSIHNSIEAITYINWRVHIEGLSHYSQLENGKLKKHISGDFMRIVSERDNNFILDFFNTVFKYINKEYWTQTLVEWFFNKILSIILVEQFHKHKFALINTISETKYRHYLFENLPVIIVEVTDDPKELIRLSVLYDEKSSLRSKNLKQAFENQN